MFWNFGKHWILDIMKFRVAISPYTLKNQSAHQNGLLLKTVSVEDGQLGFAAVQPHSLFGDPDCDAIALSLRQRKPHPLVLRTLELATSEWAKAKILLLKSLADQTQQYTANSNFLIQHLSENIQMSILEAKNLHFGTLKIKAKILDEILTQALSIARAQNFKVRIDANSQWTPETAQQYFATLDKSLLAVIEYIEDPFPLSAENIEYWQSLNAIVPLALDQCAEVTFAKTMLDATAFKHWILKPSRLNKAALHLAMNSHLPITVTSSLDHPIGIIHAFHFLAQFRKPHWSQTHGLNTFTNFLPSPYDHVFEYSSSVIRLHADTFNIAESLLEKESWQNVCELTL